MILNIYETREKSSVSKFEQKNNYLVLYFLMVLSIHLLFMGFDFVIFIKYSIKK